jgi:hypothetical protein
LFRIALGGGFMRYWQAVAGFAAVLLFAVPVRAELIVAGGSGQLVRYDQTTGASLGIFTTLPGGPPTPGPTGIAFGADGNVYVSDRNFDVVLRFNATTWAFVDTFTAFDDPQDLTFGPDGNLYVTGYSTGVRSYDPGNWCVGPQLRTGQYLRMGSRGTCLSFRFGGLKW